MGKEIIEKYLPIIRKQYPNVSADDVQLFADGHDHYVLLVNKAKAFVSQEESDLEIKMLLKINSSKILRQCLR